MTRRQFIETAAALSTVPLWGSGAARSEEAPLLQARPLRRETPLGPELTAVVPENLRSEVGPLLEELARRGVPVRGDREALPVGAPVSAVAFCGGRLMVLGPDGACRAV